MTGLSKLDLQVNLKYFSPAFATGKPERDGWGDGGYRKQSAKCWDDQLTEVHPCFEFSHTSSKFFLFPEDNMPWFLWLSALVTTVGYVCHSSRHQFVTFTVFNIMNIFVNSHSFQITNISDRRVITTPIPEFWVSGGNNKITSRPLLLLPVKNDGRWMPGAPTHFVHKKLSGPFGRLSRGHELAPEMQGRFVPVLPAWQ